MPDDATRSGGCLCGAVRYRVPASPLSMAVCHCRDCQKQAGSAFSVLAVFPRESVMLQGDPVAYEGRGDNGQPVWRHFYGQCGSPIFSDTPGMRDSGVLAIKAGTLDDVSDIKPRVHVWWCSKQPWLHLPEDTAVIERQ